MPEPSPTVSGDPDHLPETVPGAEAAEQGTALAAGPRSGSLNEGPREWQVGDVILDLYEVIGQLGEGGMGKVHKVRHRGWSVELAVKSPRPEIFARPGGHDSFVREAETWVGLGLHPHVVSCHYVRSLAGIPRIFAEYVDGGSLSDWIRAGTLYTGGPRAALERILDVAIQFAWGLDYAHENGLVHQDVKPANLMMTAAGEAKVTDFGLARARGLAGGSAGAPGQSQLVSTGGMTPAYSSPEQARGERLSRATDLWSWALSVLEMFAGGVTWVAGRAAPQALASHLETGPQDPHLPTMPHLLAQALARCFEWDPAARPLGLATLADQLREVWWTTLGTAYPRPAPREVQLTAESLNNRALSYLDLGRPDDADLLWSEAVRVHPHHPEATYNRGVRRWRAGRLGDLELVEECRAALLRHSTSVMAHVLVASVHLERDDAESALEELAGSDAPSVAPREVEACLATARARRPHASGLIRTFDKDSRSVSSMDLSGDGRHALSDAGDGTLNLWDVATGRCLRTLEGHRFQGFGTHVRMSADVRLAVSGGSDAEVKAWDLTTGRCLRVFGAGAVHDMDAVYALDLSADARRALSGHQDGSMRLWDVTTGGCLRTVATGQGSVTSVCLDRAGSLALSGGGDGRVILWDLATGRQQLVLDAHVRGVGSLDWAPDGRFVVTGGDDPLIQRERNPAPTARLWDLATGKCLRTFVGHAGPDSVRSVRLSSDGRYVISGGDWSIKLWDRATGRCRRTFAGHRERVTAVRLSNDGRLLVSGSFDGTVKAWRVDAAHRYEAPAALSRVTPTEGLLSAQGTYARALAVASQAVAAGDAPAASRQLREARSQPGYQRSPEAVEAWTRLYLQLPRRAPCTAWREAALVGHGGPVSSVDLSPDGRLALSGSKDGTVRLWDLRTRRCERVLGPHPGPVSRVQFCGGSSRALSQGATLKLWDLAQARCIRELEPRRTTGMAISTDTEGRLLACDSRNDFEVWDLVSGRRLRTLEGHRSNHVMALHMSADARYVLSGGQDHTLRLWDLASGRCLRKFPGHHREVWSVALTVDARYAMSNSLDQTIKLWRTATGECLRTIRTPRLSAAVLSQDGRHVLSRGGDETLRVWDTATGQCLTTIDGGETGSLARSLQLSHDGKSAVWGCEDGTIGVGLLDWELEEPKTENWDEAARPYLAAFLARRTPTLGRVPEDREPTEDEVRQALTRRGPPIWDDEAFASLLHTLGCVGLGWLRAEGVRRELDQMAKGWTDPAPMAGEDPSHLC